MEKEYTISAVDNKSPDWKVVTTEIVEGEGSVMTENVSVNRVNKKGETFPNFDEIIVGARIKGNLWTTPDGSKNYLFAPKPVVAGQIGGNKGGFKAGMQKMVEQKQAGIEKSQDRKEEGIKTSSTIRMATEVVVAMLKNETMDESVIKAKIEQWRKWFWMRWDDVESYPPFE